MSLKQNAVKLPSLDGWRAICIALVLGSHARFSQGFPAEWGNVFFWFFDGYLGVRFFFVISGFLITFLMIREQSISGKVSWGSFYVRRGLRILPVYFLFLSLLAVLSFFSSYSASGMWGYLMTFTVNYSHGGGWLTGHLWSLSCEEQFYLIWPALFFLWQRKYFGVGFLMGGFFVLCPVFRAVYLAFGNAVSPVVTYGMFLKEMDLIMVGCMVACFYDSLRKIVLRFFWISFFCAVGLIGLIHVLMHLPGRGYGFFSLTVGPLLQCFGFGVLLVLSIERPHGFFSPLNWRWMRWLGRLSYSIYIWQQFFCSSPKLFGWSGGWLFSFPAWIVFSLGTASLSYYFVEKPLMRLRARFR